MAGKIVVITGPMFAGKTTELIRKIKRHQLANHKVKVFKPNIDKRYDEINIVTHDGKEYEAIPIDPQKPRQILHYLDDADVVAIEEAQFFSDKIIDIVRHLSYTRGLTVYITGLDMDYQGNPFGPMPQLLAIADEVLKLKAVCVECGKDAGYTHKLVDDGKTVDVGGSEKYVPLCLDCWLKYKGKI